MSKEYWFPWCPARFRADTMHLTAEQDGIYRRLIDHYMETRLPLPDNDSALARIAGISGDSWAMASAILRPFFRAADGKLFLKKCDEILADQTARSRKNAEKGKVGASKRWKPQTDIQEENSSGHDSGLADESQEDATRQDTTGQESKKDPVVDAERVNEIFEWLQKFLNSPSPLFTAPVSAWLTWGADFDLDIKPVAQRWRKANPKKAIRSLEWLDADVVISITKRLKPMPEINLQTTEGQTHANKPNSGGTGYGTGGRKSKSEAADDAMREALADLGIPH